MIRIAFILLFCISCCQLSAQNYYNIGHASGVVSIGNIGVKVERIGSSGIYPGTNCGLGPYHIGAGTQSSVTSSGYKYSFDRAVKEVRFTMNASEPGEQISVMVNANNYTLTSANLSTYTGTCGSTGGAAIGSGKLIFTGGSNNNSILRVADSITSIVITDIDTVGGTVMTVDFVTDTTVEIVNYIDTLLCVGDTIHVGYRISGNFSASNQFQLQLSDKNGSFSLPLTLATVAGTTSGSIDAIIPVLPSSDAYKIRIVATSPAYVSKPFQPNIAIGNPPLASIFNTGPACEGGFAQLGYTNYTHFTEVRWYRWGAPIFSKLQYYSFASVKLSDAGLYYAEMQDYGCMISDTTRLHVKPNPLVSVAYNNSPVCAGDTLKLHGTIDTAGVLNVWIKPNGNTDSVKDLDIHAATSGDAGRYVLVTTLNGCIAFDTVFAAVKHRPAFTLADTSLCFGDGLHLSASDTVAGIVYQWIGPSGYNSSLKDTIISPVYFAAAGRYYVSAILNGCETRDTMDVTVKQLPIKPIALKDTSICSGESLVLAAAEHIPGTSYSWQGPAAFTASVTDTVLKTVPTTANGKYILTAHLNGCMATDTVDVIVRRSPAKPDISATTPVAKGGTILLKLNNRESDVSYTWVGPADFYSPLISPEIKNAEVRNSGVYILYADVNNCRDSSTINVEVADVADTGYFVIYPNANDGEFYIKGLLKKSQTVALRISNDVGQLVFDDRVPSNGNLLLHKVSLKGRLSSGIYMLKLIADDEERVFKLVVNR